MTVLNDNEIRLLGDNGMITPFERQQVRQINGEKVISYGVSSFGYDARLAGEFMWPVRGQLDPKADTVDWESQTIADECGFIIPPHGFVLARTVERFKMPDDVMAICVGKSTYARNGLIVNVTPLEPGWEGHVTLELSNTTDLPSVVYVGEGICQFVFFRGERPSVTYATREGGPGKYQGQVGITLPRL